MQNIDLENLKDIQLIPDPQDAGKIARRKKPKPNNLVLDQSTENPDSEKMIVVLEDPEMQEKEGTEVAEKIEPNFKEEDKVVFSGYVIDLIPFKEIGRYAAWIVFDLNLRSIKSTLKHEFEEKYEQLDKLVNDPQFKVTSNEIHKILQGLKLISQNEDSQNLTWTGPDIFNPTNISYQDLK